MPGFRLAAPRGTSIPRVVEKDTAAGYAALEGALVLVNGSNQYAECGADPALIAGVAQTAGGTDTSGYNHFASKTFPPGRLQGISPKPDVVFRAPYVGALPAADGGSYGVVKDADNYWKVDFNDAVNTRVKLVGRLTNSPENQAEVLVIFLAANIQDI